MMAVSSAMLLFPDFPGFLWPFPTLEGVAVDSTLPPGPLGVVLVAEVFPLSRRALANFLCFTGGGLSVLWLRATLAALVAGALQIPVTTGTAGPRDVVAEVLVRDLGDGRGGGGVQYSRWCSLPAFMLLVEEQEDYRRENLEFRLHGVLVPRGVCRAEDLHCKCCCDLCLEPTMARVTGERAPAFTAVELERLVDGVLPQYRMLYGPPDQQISAHQKKGIWRAIAKDMRTLGVYGTWSTHCRKQWEDLRCWARKAAEAQLGMASQRGRGACRTLTPLMACILEVAYPELDGHLGASQQLERGE
ncbi:hypothetical protein NDU88_005963 [Pleurodeles waltl]|uniref:Myb/SANT-like DNA-binding domain-containing protein n=1 Tax=Pleurodeles waltl TaxID=8319 RepID=A0AAV7PL27_PLEWA|nr:hypothetical protein NDU88_005963 [Pleurodeles waltl]